MKTIKFKGLLLGFVLLSLVSCSDDDSVVNPNKYIGKDVGVFKSAEWSPGGVLGTTSNEQGCYSNPAPAVEEQGFYQLFKKGEGFFEKDFTYNNRPYTGLGPSWTRSGCLYCHPNYGHGIRQNQYLANTQGNGYLLVIYHPTAGVDANGKAYSANSYITEVTGMPQTKAMYPFKAPLEEDGITITWKQATDEHGNKFNDGETYNLSYPDVQIAQSAFNTNPKPTNYEVRLESTIGVYGTGLLDAISQDSMKAQYQREAHYATLNSAMWDATKNDWANGAFYTLSNGEKRVKKFTYAMTRASLQDGPGANAIWNITNVTRSDRHYLYTTDAWARAMSENADVINGIQKEGASVSSLLHPYYGNGSTDSIKYLVNHLLGLNEKGDSAEYVKYFVNSALANGQEELYDEDMYAFAVWQRGLGVPQARNLESSNVQRGKKLFYLMGCTECHRPSWTITNDNYWSDDIIRKLGKKLPEYSNTVIWPYTDLVQHRLYMENDIRTGWCRTTPLWGRGLAKQETGSSDRLHDCRAQTVVEAIMWHGYSKKSDAYQSTQKFYNLSKKDRDAVVAFIEAI